MYEPFIALLPGERLLWSGSPQRVAPTGIEWFVPAAGTVVAALCALVAPIPEQEFPFANPILAILTFASAWGLVLARMGTARRSGYAVTDQRVLIADRVSGRIRYAAALGTYPPSVTWLGRGGLGTVTFTEPDLVVDVLGYSVPVRLPGRRSPLKFVAVAEPERLRELIELAQAAD
ncbi:hypothetical protein [Amycolatopsis sp. NPDC098790]|uniref:hypothetical protein n=1 Tax=Amycolatopsis sp. NPDC098790 TaxID=3363939 RepID=UPI00380A2CF0